MPLFFRVFYPRLGTFLPAKDNYLLTGVFSINWGLLIMADWEQKKLRLRRVLVCTEVDLASASFKPNELTAHNVDRDSETVREETANSFGITMKRINKHRFDLKFYI